VCTGLAYVLYFRLIAHAGPANAIAVTYLIPAFAVLWGGLFLGERPTAAMLAGCAVILIGTALATGLLRPRLRVAG
jgi:drug/metabolite transporter (DMT)-like permease